MRTSDRAKCGGAGRDAHDSLEMTVEMALIGKACSGGQQHARHTPAKQAAGMLDAHVNLKRIDWYG